MIKTSVTHSLAYLDNSPAGQRGDSWFIGTTHVACPLQNSLLQNPRRRTPPLYEAFLNVLFLLSR